MAALLPTPSSDLDPGSRQRPGQQQVTISHYSRICSSFLPWNHRKGAAEGKGCIRRSFFLPFPFFSKCPCLQFCLCCFASSPYLPISPLSLPFLLSLFLFSFSLVSSLAFFSLEPCLAHLPAPTSCAILVVCSGLGQGQTWQNWWIPVEAAEPLGSHPIPSSRGCTGE